ncbi:cytochrome c peroxidase [Flavobacterium sp. DG1-102-2]|uniref:cytochrome-c peroxidase n=1 Tax=Flavobacterium sp. DG1-102-2 TaxID=3081663 RepID=UPI002949357F|nr:cytochrome c peroxidase [Flavobacterium sp. DG1-102-2]MDV6166839.1 cytochrome c peroxidase [Flavobacterium sp. DG1-102-2]
MRFNYSKIKIAAVSTVAVMAGVMSFSFSATSEYEISPVVLNKFTLEFNQAVHNLDASAQGYRNGKVTLDSLRSSVAATRISYKKVEFYLAFHYTEYVNEHINGAPLLHIEKSGTSPIVLTPEGLQVMDELVFSDEAAAEKVQIAAVAKKLSANYSLLFNSLTTKLKDEGNVAAMRIQLVRIYSLGITGFDTPGSLNAIPEAKASLQGMKTFYAENYSDAKNTKVQSLFDDAVAYLDKNSDFDTLDRLEILKKYIDPLYSELGKIEKGAAPDFLIQTTSWNANSTSIFGNDFLNPYFFTDLKKGEDSEALRSLGEELFYDTAISGDGVMSCASCHQPEKGYADGIVKSVSSIKGKNVMRNAPTLVNAVYADRFFYDLRAFTLEQQAEHVIFNPEEFNTAYSSILKKLGTSKKYAAQFKSVFGKGEVTREKFSKALASYVLSLRSYNSDFDKYVRGESKELSQDVKNGFNLFMGKAACGTCHFAPTFAGLVPPFYNENESEILGVLADPKAKNLRLDSDEGRWSNTVLSEYAWIYEKSFKTNSVRNAGLTAPYFHNGAYTTLEEVIDFYNNGGGGGLGLNVINQTLSSDPLNLTDTEKKELIAFIKSLNDIPVRKPVSK